MNGDNKTGLALGVLLVGIVGAFFFRNEPSPRNDTLPQLENPQKLDAQIAEKSRIPYLTGVETDDPLSDAPPFGAASNQNAFPPATTDFEPTLDGDAFETPFADSRPAPDPIHAPVAADRRFSHNNAWQVVTDGSEPPTQPVTATNLSDRVHEVRQGDTLSGLAFQYLGSSARYHEIFQANRDLLKSPNDLRIGMKLRIPPRDAARTAGGESPVPADSGSPLPARTINTREGPTAQNAASRKKVDLLPESPPAENAPAPPPRTDGRMFRPVPRSPFDPGRSSTTGAWRQIPAQPVKSLTQQPPGELPIPDESAWTEPSAIFEAGSEAPKAAGMTGSSPAR